MQKLTPKNPNDTNIDLVFLLYWGALVFWQSINPGSTGSMADTLIKTCLICFLVAYYLWHTSAFGTRALGLVALFGLNMALSFLSETSITLRSILTYFFPVAFAFLALCTGGRFQIKKQKLLRFMHIIIVMVLYMALYAIIVTPQKFIGALSASGAYGNELSSFFISNHEYGTYLMAGITACIVCIELEKDRSFLKNLLYGASLVLFCVNLILTYSRTSMLATALIVLAYVVLNRGSRFGKKVLIFLVASVVAVLTVPFLRDYFFRVVLKENNLAGRDDLASAAIEIFEGGGLVQKLWGQGATLVSSLLRDEAGHASAHNAYLETLLCFGFWGLCAMLLFMFSQLIASLKILKSQPFIGVCSIGLIFACASTMFTNTAVLFSSPIDSFFLTMFTILVPRYVRNAVLAGTFDAEDSENVE